MDNSHEEPIAYTLGWQPFFGLKIYLDSRPLIPRPETEWWTEKLLQTISESGIFPRREYRSETAREEAIRQQTDTPLSSRELPPLQFLDLCAGSGAIGCAALKMLPDVQVYFGEIDPAHEATILRNIRENTLDQSSAHVCIGDLFEPFGDTQFDVIATNPPYIPVDRELPASVAEYEPSLALRSGSDGLDLIRRIAASVRRRLTEKGVVWCECDSSYAEMTRALFEEQGLHTEVLLDQYGEPRVICAKMI